MLMQIIIFWIRYVVDLGQIIFAKIYKKQMGRHFVKRSRRLLSLGNQTDSRRQDKNYIIMRLPAAARSLKMKAISVGLRSFQTQSEKWHEKSCLRKRLSRHAQYIY